MELKTMKTLALTSAVALGIATSGPAFAQVETVDAQLITSSAITSTDVSDMDFGEWLVQFVAGDTPTITLTDDGTVASTQTGAVGNGSQVIQITAPATEGVVRVQCPAPATLVMTRSNSSDFADGGLSLTATTFRTATENGNIDADTDTANITVLAGATDEDINFGGDIDVTATPADNTHTASFDVTFTY